MKRMTVLLFVLIALAAAIPFALAQNAPFEDFLKKNAQAWQSYQTILQAYKDNPDIEGNVRDIIDDHTQMVDNNLMSAMQTLVKARSAAATDEITATPEYAAARSKFLDVCRTAFKKDDDLRQEVGDDQFVNWLFSAAAFLATENAAFVASRQDQAKSWRVGSAVLTFETGVLIQAVSQGKRDDASLGELFRKQTLNLLNWIYKIPVDDRN